MAANASGIRAGRAYVEVGTDETSLEKGLKSAEAKVKAFGSAITAVGTSVLKVGAAITLPFLTAAKVFADTGSSLNDMSTRTGLSVEALSVLEFAAKQSGTDIEAVELAVRKMQKAMVAGSEENLQAAATFASLGLEVKDLLRLKPEQQIDAIFEAIARIPNPTARAGAAMQIFGKTGTRMLPMIEDFQNLIDGARNFGLVFTGKEAKRADALGDSIDLLKSSLGRLIGVIGDALAPLLTEVATDLARAARYAMDFAKANGPLIVTIFKISTGIIAAGAAFLALGAAISGLGFLLGTLAGGIGVVRGLLFGTINLLIRPLGTVSGLLAGLGSIITFLASPVGILAVALAGIVTYLVMTSNVAENAHSAMSALGEGFQSLKETAVEAFKGIGDALKAGDIALAGQILWAGLKVEFLKGINFLKGLWGDWGTASIEVFRGVSFGIARSFTDAWAAIQSGFVNALATMRVSFTNFSSFLMKAWNNIGGFFATVWEKIKALFKGGDIEAEVKRINEQTAAANAAQETKRSEGVAAINAGRAEQLKGIEEGRQGARAAITDQQQAETDARRKAAQEGLAKDAEALKAAQEELAGLVGQAGEKAARAAVVPKLKKVGVPEFEPAALGEAVQSAKAKVDVTGTFSVAATRGLGVGTSIQDEQLNEQKKANKTLESLNHKADIGRLVFS